MSGQRERITADDLASEFCTVGGVGHDYRVHVYRDYPKAPEYSSWRCVWCHVLACGNVGQADPCWLPYHHRADHRSRAGVTWPLGGNRPDDGRLR